MRYADVGGGRIVFTYEDDLWLVPETGGQARRITSHQGAEQYAKFNSDGSKLALAATMFIGRVSFLTILTGIARQFAPYRYAPVQYPEEDIFIN